MPGITQKIKACGSSGGTANNNSLVANEPLPFHSFNGSSVSSNGFWSKQRDDTNYIQLHKFWCELTTQARHKIMRIDKQTLFEHARKNMYCSRCNGLLLEGFLQILFYGKSVQRNATSGHYSGQITNNQNCDDTCNDNECQYDVIDPAIHPWGGLTSATDGTLTLLECYIHSKSFKGLQNVFDSARARERERKLLYPDACGGGGRGWISHGITGYCKGLASRETCALHTARLSVETLVDFWSALGEETRQSLLRMKEEDFIERLMYRFDRKRFCRDCRRNVIREFKELKELKRTRKDPHCTNWFCVADSVFQYEVSHDTVQADWHQMFLDAYGTFHHFEWAIGTGEGKSDIMDFKNVGLSVRVEVNGLDLSGLSACYITLRAWKMDGRCNEHCVKAHALLGQQCVHCRLAIGDGYVTTTIGGNIRRFFEHAEEAEEEEDDDSTNKDGDEFDGECTRPRKHAKSPELAREFLLDAAAVIFKEQVEKAFREGTARKNAHSIFVCLALKLLEERVHVASKEIVTLEKQMKLIEEEETEKREEEERKERKERRRTKERGKKLRRKERLREKENKEQKGAESNKDILVLDTQKEVDSCVDEGVNIGKTRDCTSEAGEATPPGSPLPPDIQSELYMRGYISKNIENLSEDNVSGESCRSSDYNPPSTYHQYSYSSEKSRLHKDTEPDLSLKWSGRIKGATLSENGFAISKYHADGFESTRSINCFSKQLRYNAAKFNTRNGPKLSEKLQCARNRVGDTCDSHVCSCNHNDYGARSEYLIMSSSRESSCDISKSYYNGKCAQAECARENNRRVKTKASASNSPVVKKVWEALDSQKKSVYSNLVTLKPKAETAESDRVPEPSNTAICSELTGISVKNNDKDNEKRELASSGNETCRDTENDFYSRGKSDNYIKVEQAEYGKLCFMATSPHRTGDSLMSSSSNSDKCSSSCSLSEGESNTLSSNRQSTSTSDSEDCSQVSDVLHCLENGFSECHKVVDDQNTTRRPDDSSLEPASGAPTSVNSLLAETTIHCENRKANVGVNVQSQSALPAMIHNQSIQYPVYQVPAMGYYHQSPVSWPADPTNGLMSFHYSNHYLFANGFGYDLNTNPQYMQYGALQQFPTPSISPVHMPVFPPVIQANPGVVKEIHHSIQTVGGTPTVMDGGQNGMPDNGNADFSLFHFGGPVAISAGFKAEGVKVSAPDANRACNRTDPLEYNLFAASNGIKFSIL